MGRCPNSVAIIKLASTFILSAVALASTETCLSGSPAGEEAIDYSLKRLAGAACGVRRGSRSVRSEVDLIRRRTVPALLVSQIAPSGIGAGMSRHIGRGRQILTIIKKIG